MTKIQYQCQIKNLAAGELIFFREWFSGN